MKNLVWVMILVLGISLVSAYDFCDDGEEGNLLTINSINDTLDDNDVAWEWAPGDDVELEINVSTLKDESSEYNVEIVFLDEDNDEYYVADNSDDLDTDFGLEAEETKTVTISFTVDEDADEGDYDIYVKFYEDGNESDECTEERTELVIQGIIVCEEGSVDDSYLEIDSIEDLKIENDYEWEWSPGDEVEIEVKVSNEDYSDRDFDVELIFFDEDGEEISFADNSDDLKESIDIAEDESEIVTFNFDVADDIDEGDYTLYAKVTDGSDASICTSLKAEELDNEIKVEISEDLGVVISTVDGPSNIEEGETGNYTIKVKNYGNANQAQVQVIAYNSYLSIRIDKVIYDLAAKESRDVSFSIKFPDNASEVGTAKLQFSTAFDYDEDKDYYETESSSGADKLYAVQISEGTTKPVAVISNTTSQNTSTGERITSTESDEEGSSIGWILIVILLVLIGVGIVLFFRFRRDKIKYKTYSVRQYTVPSDSFNQNNY